MRAPRPSGPAGGLLTAAGGWRWVFLVNVPIGLLALGLGVRLLPATPTRRHGDGVGLVGVVLLGGGIASIMLPLIEQEQSTETANRWPLGLAMALLGLAAAALGLVATALIIRTDPHGTIWLDLLVPPLVAGLGGDLVIGPNQTLALQHVAPAVSGTAAAMLQTAQRIGMSIGTAIVATLFFGRLGVAHGGYSTAASTSLCGAAAMVAVALVIAAADLAVNRRPHDGEMSSAAAVPPDESAPDVVRWRIAR